MEYEILQEAKKKNFSVHLEKRKNNKIIYYKKRLNPT